jgi:hypothetical protein
MHDAGYASGANWSNDIQSIANGGLAIIW